MTPQELRSSPRSEQRDEWLAGLADEPGALDDDRIGRARPRSRHVLLLGTHGQANIGDELLLETFLGELGDHHRYTVNSYDPAGTADRLAGRFDVTTFATTGSRLELVRRLRAADVVVFAGGNIVKELYRSTGRWRYSTLCMILAVVVAARALGRPVLMSNIGVGPIESRTGRFLARMILRLATLVSVRDTGSYATCIELGCSTDRVCVVPDAVWATDPTKLGHPLAHRRSDDDILKIALNLNKDVEAADDWEMFLDHVVEAIDALACTTRVEVHALPMQCAFKDGTDLEVLTDVLDRVGVPAIVHRPSDHHQVAMIISSCDVVVSERLHAIVLAAILGRPVVPLPYDVKVRELVTQLDLEHRAHAADASVQPWGLARSILDAATHSTEGLRLAELAAHRRHEAAAHFDAVRRWIDTPHRSWSARPPG